MIAQLPGPSPKRLLLCRRENANRVAARLFDPRPEPLRIVRTANPLQPFRVCTSPSATDVVEVEMVF